jgi:hypothetical protein
MRVLHLACMLPALIGLTMLPPLAMQARGAPQCRGISLDQRLTIIEQQSALARARYRFTIERDTDISATLYLIIQSTTGYEAASLLYIRGCEAPIPALVLDPEEAAEKHFGRPLAMLFSLESDI